MVTSQNPLRLRAHTQRRNSPVEIMPDNTNPWPKFDTSMLLVQYDKSISDHCFSILNVRDQNSQFNIMNFLIESQEIPTRLHGNQELFKLGLRGFANVTPLPVFAFCYCSCCFAFPASLSGVANLTIYAAS